MDLIIKVYEGKQARVNDVNFTGNYRVDDKVIRRELYVRPGELYDRSMLMATLRQLSQMQHFDPEKLQPNIVPYPTNWSTFRSRWKRRRATNSRFRAVGVPVCSSVRSASS
ncbi:MAG: POTRA domain-containing protein [Alistipes indistinctus]